MTLFRTIEVKFGLATGSKWTSEHDVFQDVCVCVYTHICKSEVSKIYTIIYTLYTPEFYYFLCVILKLYMLRMTQKLYFLESIHYMIYDLY